LIDYRISEDGKGALSIENFELGVCVEQAEWPFEQLDEFQDENDIATVAGLASRSSPQITWARATWDGREIAIECRCQATSELSGELRAGTETTPFSGWKSFDDADGLYRANLPYMGEWHSPFVIELTCGSECLRIPIFDERKLIDREKTILPEVDQALIQTLSDNLLFEEYGGRTAADDPDIDSADGDITNLAFPEDEGDDDTTGASRSESYAVPAFVLARRHLAVVDIWADAVKDLSKRQAGDFRRKLLQRATANFWWKHSVDRQNGMEF